MIFIVAGKSCKIIKIKIKIIKMFELSTFLDLQYFEVINPEQNRNITNA